MARRLEAVVSQERVPAVYARIARIYDLWAALTETRARRACLERAAVRDGESVLEVAVGTGLAFRELVRANPSGLTEGVDLTEAMLARARHKVAGLPGRHRLQVGDARHLEFPDASFDVLVYRVRPELLGCCRGVTLAPSLSAAGFVEVRRESLSQLGFPSEIVTARVPAAPAATAPR
jgi:SAM-dependent methyltransferase